MTLIFYLVYIKILIYLRIPDFFSNKIIIFNQSNSNRYKKNTIFLFMFMHSQQLNCRLKIKKKDFVDSFLDLMDTSLN